MKILAYHERTYDAWKSQLNRISAPNPKIEKTVATILKEVKKSGDKAIRKYTQKFDKVTLKKFALTTTPQKPNTKITQALKKSHKNIHHFSKQRTPKSWQTKNSEGARVGEQFYPFGRVGIYIPGGTAPLVSTALMTITLAATAKCPEIVVVTPPPIDPTLHFAIRLAGATEIYQIGGVQAIGALAYGTSSIPRVQKIFGPGNAFVTEAKRQVIGYTSIDQLPGPSEIMIIADASANPNFIASDLLAQAEHGFDSLAILLTPSLKLRNAVAQKIQQQLKTLPRKNILQKSLKKGTCLVQTKTLQEAIALANDYAPEHLSLQINNPHKWLSKIKNAGAIFLGNFSPVVTGDFLAGPSHTLPTGGSGKLFSGLTVDQFFQRTSFIEYSQASLKKSVPTLKIFSNIEKLDAHGRSAQIRFEK